MKHFVFWLLFTGFSAVAQPGQFLVGETLIKVNAPQDYILVTEQMEGAHRLIKYMEDETNDLLAFYIPSQLESDAMFGEVPELTRYHLIKVNKQLKGTIVGNDDFTELKEATKQQNQAKFQSVISSMNDAVGEKNSNFTDEFNVDFAMKLSQVVPFDVHYETDNGFAYSMYLNMNTTVAEKTEQSIIAATASLVNVSGKIVFLYSYGARDDLDWTREVSKQWMSDILGNNEPPPEVSTGSGINWDRVKVSAIQGGIFGFLIALFSLVVGRIKKKKQQQD